MQGSKMSHPFDDRKISNLEESKQGVTERTAGQASSGTRQLVSRRFWPAIQTQRRDTEVSSYPNHLELVQVLRC